MPPTLSPTTRDSLFAFTRWTIVRQAADSQTSSEHALSALSELCQIYWRPVYLFLRRQGLPRDDAQDLTQSFFCRIYRRPHVRPGRSNEGTVSLVLARDTKAFPRARARS